MRISRISAQAFRGFPGLVHFSLSEAITVIFAPNGSGKTSLSEAFEWTLYGEVARKLRSKTPGEFGQEFLRSAHADSNDETWAEVELIKDDGKKITVKRTMNKGGETVLTVDGRKINDVTEIAIETGLSFRPCLGQSEIKAFIDTEPKERWKQISAILGLGGFEVVRDKLMKLKTDTDKNLDVMQVRESARRAVAPLIPVGSDPLGQEPTALLRSLREEMNLQESSGWPEVIVLAEKKITALLSMDKKPASLEQMIAGPEEIELDGLDAEVTRINDGLESHRAWHDANKRKKFVELGLKITVLPECPYCEEKTITNEKVTKLQKYVENGEKEPPELNAQFSQVIAGFQVIKTAPLNSAVLGSLIDALSDVPEIVTELEALPAIQKSLNDQLTSLGSQARGYLTATHSQDKTPIEDVKKLGSELLNNAKKLASEYATFRKDIQKTRERIQAKFKGLSTEERASLERHQAIKRLATDIKYVQQAWEISKRQAELDAFVRSFEQGEKDTVQGLEKELADDVKNYLEQLSSSKSLKFERFKIKPGVRRQAVLEATAYNVPVNPTSMFSEAQGNCLGLSLYFSQRVNRNPGWKSIILDDPVQSMDDDHKGNLITLLSTLDQTHQIVVFTHDRSFKNSIASQFTHHSKYLEYEIVKTDKSPVPEIREQLQRFDQLLNYANICADGPSVQRETGFNTLRKAIESLVKGIAIKNKVTLTKGGDLEQHIKDLLNNPLNATDAGTIQRVRHDCNPGSHDSGASTAPGIIKGFIGNLEAIKKSYLS